MKQLAAAVLPVVLFLGLPIVKAQVLHLGMGKKEIAELFPKGALAHVKGEIDTNLVSDAPSYDDQLTYSVAGYQGEAFLYFDSVNRLKGYEWKTFPSTSEVRSSMDKISSYFNQLYDSTTVETPASNKANFTRRIIYYKNHQKTIILSQLESSISYSEGELLLIINVPSNRMYNNSK